MRIPIFTPGGDAVPIREENATNLADDARTIIPQDDDNVSLQLHPIPSRDALLVKIQPPKEPDQEIKHVPCDIMLVIDVSGSMGARADVPGDDPSESTGLTVLDLVKHAAMTIIETLDEGDRLGVVTFSSDSEVIQGLTAMTDENKEDVRQKIRKIGPLNSTNLWGGIQKGIKVFRAGGSSARVPSIMVLTDGKPNYMCPSKGYVPRLRNMLPLPASISTFGFGYNLESGLLKSIAEISGGSYAFIPDAGMIGTVFVHAVANLQSTFATNATLDLQFTHPLKVEETTGKTVDQLAIEEDGQVRRMRLLLGNLQYGQSRDIFLRVTKIPPGDPFDAKGLATITAGLSYETPETGPIMSSSSADLGGKVSAYDTGPAATAHCSMMADSDLPEAEVAYHESRSRICAFLSSLFPIKADGNHDAIYIEMLLAKLDELNRLIRHLPAGSHDDARNQSLLEDLSGRAPHGQISLSMVSDYFTKWGKHYLPSLLNAHVRQACNSFKDPGPLQYGVDSPLFARCRDVLDDAFDNLPPPSPSLHLQAASGGGAPVIQMSRYRNPCGVCFAGSTPVELSSGRTVPIRKLRRGVKVRTPAGPRKVAAVLKTPVEGETLCRVGGVLVTPWHPVSGDGKTWAFPAALADRAVRYTGCVYSVMLQRDGDRRAHGIRVGGSCWGVTLGHGVVSGAGDVRAHEFFGDWERVAKAFLGMGIRDRGIVVGKGVERDRKTGLVVGFRRGE